MATKQDKNGWLRDALIDAGHQQKDVAKAWGCDDAVVSRFIKTGTPELTWDRAQILARMLSMSLEELKIRLEGGVAPRRRTPTAPAGSRDAVLNDLKAAVDRARVALPNDKIEVRISHAQEDTL